MDRRHYLLTLGSGLTASTLAGCLSDFSETTDLGNGASDGKGDGDDSSGNGEETEESREADRQIRTAAGQLNRSGASLRESQGELEDPENSDYDPDEPMEFLETGLDALRTARDEDPTAEQEADIEELAAYASVLEELIAVTATVTDDTLEARVDEINDAVDETDLETARDIATDLATTFGGANDRLEDAHETLEELDDDRLDSLEITALEDVESGAAILEDVVESLATLSASMVTFVDAHKALEEGRDHLEAEVYDDAIHAFEMAADDYTETARTLEEDEGAAPEGLRTYFETLGCQATNLEDAALAFADAGRAGRDDDPAGAEAAEADAEDALERAEDCRS